MKHFLSSPVVDTRDACVSRALSGSPTFCCILLLYIFHVSMIILDKCLRNFGVQSKLEDAETAYHCLTLHHSRLDGRLINVERTSGGGKVRTNAE